MQINTNTIVSVTEANQNFSRVTRIAEKNGQAVIFKNNRPKYMVVDLEHSPMLELTDDEKTFLTKFRNLDKNARIRLSAYMQALNDMQGGKDG